MRGTFYRGGLSIKTSSLVLTLRKKEGDILRDVTSIIACRKENIHMGLKFCNKFYAPVPMNNIAPLLEKYKRIVTRIFVMQEEILWQSVR